MLSVLLSLCYYCVTITYCYCYYYYHYTITIIIVMVITAKLLLLLLLCIANYRRYTYVVTIRACFRLQYANNIFTVLGMALFELS